jgi:hypothetical protein
MHCSRYGSISMCDFWVDRGNIVTTILTGNIGLSGEVQTQEKLRLTFKTFTLHASHSDTDSYTTSSFLFKSPHLFADFLCRYSKHVSPSTLALSQGAGAL